MAPYSRSGVTQPEIPNVDLKTVFTAFFFFFKVEDFTVQP